MHFFYLAPFYLTTLALAAPRFPSKHALIARAFEEDGESDWLAEEPSPELERGSLCIPLHPPPQTPPLTRSLGTHNLLLRPRPPINLAVAARRPAATSAIPAARFATKQLYIAIRKRQRVIISSTRAVRARPRSQDRIATLRWLINLWIAAMEKARHRRRVLDCDGRLGWVGDGEEGVGE